MKQHIKLIIARLLLLTFFITSCNQTRKSTKKLENSTENSIVDDRINHGYNELANPSNRKSFTISDYNTDNSEIKNIDRPNTSVIKTNLDTSLLFGIWTNAPEGPHAYFQLTSESFFVVDYECDGNMPYELTDE